MEFSLLKGTDVIVISDLTTRRKARKRKVLETTKKGEYLLCSPGVGLKVSGEIITDAQFVKFVLERTPTKKGEIFFRAKFEFSAMSKNGKVIIKKEIWDEQELIKYGFLKTK